jgi:hypothetical protein
MDQTPAGGQACYIYIYITDRGQNLKDLSLGLTLEEKESKNQQRIRISFMKPLRFLKYLLFGGSMILSFSNTQN